MNETIERELKEAFLLWRQRLKETDEKYSLGVITYQVKVERELDAIQMASREMFRTIHQNSDW